MTIGAANNISSVLMGMQVPFNPWTIMKTYVPFINWDQLEEDGQKYAAEKVTEDQLKINQQSQQQQMGGGGGF